MLSSFFAKNNFEQIDYYFEQLFDALELSPQAIKIKKQPASYTKPYHLLIESKYNNRNVTWSVSHSKLAKKKIKKQLEIVITLDNKSWLFLNIYQKSLVKTRKKLDLESISFLPLLDQSDIRLETNNSFFVSKIIDEEWCQKWVELNQFSVEELLLDQQKIYLKVNWIPDSYEKTRALYRLFLFLIELVKEVEK